MSDEKSFSVCQKKVAAISCSSKIALFAKENENHAAECNLVLVKNVYEDREVKNDFKLHACGQV